MATRLPDGRYQARALLPNGKRKAFYGETDAEAERLKAEFTRSISDVGSPDDPTFHEFCKTDWFPSIEPLSRLTKKRYEGTYRNHLRGPLGTMRLSQIRYADCQALINRLDMEPSGVRFVKSLLVSILNHAERLERINKNPARLVRVPPRPKHRERVLSPSEARIVLALSQETSVSCPVYLALVLGLRRGEVCGLKWGDLDRVGGRLHIRRQALHLKGYGGGVELKGLKSAAGARVLPLTKGIVEQIDRRGNLDSEFVCGDSTGALNPHTLHQRFVVERARIGLPEGYTFHDLRRCAASLMHQAGVSLMTASKVMGHADPMMSRLYTSLQESEAGVGIAAVGELLDKAETDAKGVASDGPSST